MRNHVAIAAAGLLVGAGTAATLPAHGTHEARPLAAMAVSTFTNGSFETPAAPARYGPDEPKGPSMGQWEVTSGNVDLVGPSYWEAAEGDQSLDLNGQIRGAVSQTFTTDPGTRYTVTYALAGYGNPTMKTGNVLIDGQNFQSLAFDSSGSTPTDMGWVGRHFTFVATGATTTLSFVSTNTSDQGPIIDDVSVSSSCGVCSSHSHSHF